MEFSGVGYTPWKEAKPHTIAIRTQSVQVAKIHQNAKGTSLRNWEIALDKTLPLLPNIVLYIDDLASLFSSLDEWEVFITYCSESPVTLRGPLVNASTALNGVAQGALRSAYNTGEISAHAAVPMSATLK